jgi:hypothetical protein
MIFGDRLPTRSGSPFDLMGGNRPHIRPAILHRARSMVNRLERYRKLIAEPMSEDFYCNPTSLRHRCLYLARGAVLHDRSHCNTEGI